MSTTYELAADETLERVDRMIERYHPDLKAVGLMIEVLMARNDETNAIKSGGYPALACIKINDIKARVAGRKDAVMMIDGDAYDDMSPEQRDALIDHEITHLLPVRDEGGIAWEFDDHHRPKLRIRHHDRQYGWFDDCARRHGENSIEAMQARRFYTTEEGGQLYLKGMAPKGKGRTVEIKVGE